MKLVPIAVAGAIAMSSPAFAQAPPAQPQMPAFTTNPAELPKVFAVAIRVADMAKSVRFYKEAMGATRVSQLRPNETNIGFPSGASINLVQPAAGSPKSEGPVGFIFQTTDIDALVKRVAAAGGTVARQPSDGKATGGVRVAFVIDPDGARIEVIQFPANFQAPGS